jgi:hypothetical protein
MPPISHMHQVSPTLEEVRLRFPGVRFVGTPCQQWFIDSQASLEPGAVIDISQNLYISSTSLIARDAIITGGQILSSAIFGHVSGGRIERSIIEEHASVSGGLLHDSVISGRGCVSGGMLRHSTVTDTATVTGGLLNNVRVEDARTVTEGWLNNMTVSDNLSRSRLIQNHTDVNNLVRMNESTPENLRISHEGRNRPPESTDSGLNPQRQNDPSDAARLQLTNNFRKRLLRHLGNTFPLGLKLSRRPQLVDSSCQTERKSEDSDPPEGIVDNIISFDIINKAVCTPNGDTDDESVILRWISEHHTCPVTRRTLKESDLCPNRALQTIIDNRKSNSSARI